MFTIISTTITTTIEQNNFAISHTAYLLLDYISAVNFWSFTKGNQEHYFGDALNCFGIFSTHSYQKLSNKKLIS